MEAPEPTPEDAALQQELAAARDRFDRALVGALAAHGEAIAGLKAEIELLKKLLGGESYGQAM